MQLSPSGRRLIQSFEGFSATAYPDAGGYSIGYGHFGASPGDVITQEEADRLFQGDVAKFEYAVSTIVPNATQNEFDAMVSLAYNVGTGGFAGSTVARLHNMGDRQGAADAFRMWNKSQGSVNQALSRRREKERDVYLNGYVGETHYPQEPIEQSVQWPMVSPEPTASPEPEISPSGGWAPAVPFHAKAGFAGSLLLGIAWLVWRTLHR